MIDVVEGIVVRLAVGLDDLLELSIAVGVGVFRAILVIYYLEGDVLAGHAFGIFLYPGLKEAAFLLIGLAMSVWPAKDVGKLLLGLGQQLCIGVFTFFCALLIYID